MYPEAMILTFGIDPALGYPEATILAQRGSEGVVPDAWAPWYPPCYSPW
jgi:hypothetical protein